MIDIIKIIIFVCIIIYVVRRFTGYMYAHKEELHHPHNLNECSDFEYEDKFHNGE